MKKVITILITICILLCGCNKEAPATTPTEQPVSTVTQEPTVDLPKCALCKNPGTLQEYVVGVWDEELGRERRKAWDVCGDCYNKLKAIEKDAETYNLVFQVAGIALADAEVYKENMSSDAGYIIIDQSGIYYENIGAKYKASLEKNFADIFGKNFGTTVYTDQEYTIKVEKATCSREQAPQIPLASLGE
jgi:hypothetical protein